MLSPMQHPASQTNNTDSSDKSRPEDFNIKSFVPTKPLPIPTPSRYEIINKISLFLKNLKNLKGPFGSYIDRIRTFFDPTQYPCLLQPGGGYSPPKIFKIDSEILLNFCRFQLTPQNYAIKRF